VDKRTRAFIIGLAATSLGFVGAAKLMRAKPGEAPKSRMLNTRLAGGLAFLDSSWDLPATRTDRVDFFIDFLSGEKYDEMRQWLGRLGRYGPMIQAKLSERGMPIDLVYLAVIESGLDPNAYSKADAAGMWQFVAETGRRYGLEVSEYVDERRDPIKATDAALDYLQDLHDHFGSWYLAAAAYNTGENRIERILQERAGGETGREELYWQIGSFIPKETRDYVPLMLAAGFIGKDPAGNGFLDLQFEEPLAFDEVRVPAGTPLSEVAAAAGVDSSAIEDLNPHLVKKTTPPDRDWDVRVPVGSGERVADALGVGR